MTWITIPKPTGTPYTNVNLQGKEQYDQASLAYDDMNTFYDGVDQNAWIDVAKPSGTTTFTLQAGMATGLIMPPTYSTTQTISQDQWNRVAKPSP